MTVRSRSIRLLLIATIFVIGVSCGNGVFAQGVSDRILSRSQINENATCAALTIYFNIPMRYVSHFPAQRSDELRVRITPIEAVPGVDSSTGARESLRPPGSRTVSIRRIEFEGDRPEGATLAVYFERPVNYGVRQGEDFRSIVITISGDRPFSACSGAGGEKTQVAGSRPARTVAPNALYVLNLMSSARPITIDDLPPPAVFEGYTLYTTRFETDGQIWYRLRLGFFESREEAQQVVSRFAQYFSSPWITKVTPAERDQALAAPVLGSARKEPETAVAPSPLVPEKEDQVAVSAPEAEPEWAPAPSRPEDQVVVSSEPEGRAATLTEEDRTLLSDARAALQRKDYAQAIRLLTKLRQTAGGRTLPAALELLGLARERNGQLAHAKAEYDAYLRDFPDADGAARVRQRLAALLSVGKPPQKRLRTAKAREPRGQGNWRLHGSISQTYARDETSRSFILSTGVNPTEETLQQLNELQSVAHIIGGFSNDRHEAEIRFSGSYTNDFRKEAEGDRQTISSLYLNLADNEWRMNLRLGRQPRSSGGVLGRFDGGLLGFQLLDEVKLNLVSGFPVLSYRDTEIKDDRHFFGASADIGKFIDGLDTTFYYIKQFVVGLVDREAAGMEVRYAGSRQTAFATVDYDLFYGQLNLALFNGTWIFENNSTLSLSIDYRKAPLLTTYNALLGQGLAEFSELTGLYTEEEIRQLAEDRTASARTASVAFSTPLSKRLQLSANALVADISETVASGGVDATPGSGPDYFVSTQLIGSSLLKDGDIGIVGFRYQRMTQSDRYFIDVNGRYPVTRRFRINPRFRIGYRQDKEVDFTQFSYKPSLRLNYYPFGNFVLEVEAGMEWLSDTLPTGEEKSSSQFVTATYRVDF